MTETKSFDWVQIMRIGLLAGVITLYTAMVGMIELFNEREIVHGVISLGQVLLFAAAIIGGYIIARRTQGEPNFGPIFLNGLVGGLFSAFPLILLIILANLIDLRPMLVNITKDLLTILTLNQESQIIGSSFLLMALTLGGVLGAIVALIPETFRRALITAVIWLLGVGVMSELINQVLKQFLDRDTLRIIFNSGTLRLPSAITLFIAVFSLSLLWAYLSPSIQRNINSMPAARQGYLRGGGYSVLGLLLLMLPWVLGSYLSEVMVNIGLFILMGLGLNIAIGLAGLLDLGYVTNFAVGAYVMAVLTSTGPIGFASRTGVEFVNFWLVLPISVLCAMFTGFILALPVLKMRGDYLAIATLGFGEIIRLLALSNWLQPLIGGAQGILFIPKASLFGFEFSGPQQIYYIIFAACLFMLFISIRINNSRSGRQWMAMREDEDVAAAMGIDTTLAKLLAFTLSAASGGLAGAIFASKLGTIFPHSFNLLISINALSLIIIGGMGSIPGIVVGAIVLIGLPELLREFSEFRLLLYGALLITMMLVRPEGLWPSTVTRRELQQSTADPSADMPAAKEPT